MFLVELDLILRQPEVHPAVRVCSYARRGHALFWPALRKSPRRASADEMDMSSTPVHTQVPGFTMFECGRFHKLSV